MKNITSNTIADSEYTTPSRTLIYQECLLRGPPLCVAKYPEPKLAVSKSVLNLQSPKRSLGTSTSRWLGASVSQPTPPGVQFRHEVWVWTKCCDEGLFRQFGAFRQAGRSRSWEYA